MDKEPLETDYIKIWISNGIIHTEFRPNLKISLDIAKKIVDQRKEYTEGATYKAIVDISNIKKVELNAREYWASEDSYACLSQLAIFSPSTFSKIIANFWLKVSKPYRPTKFFTNKSSAYIYLNQSSQN
jgi:hypothetical protein